MGGYFCGVIANLARRYGVRPEGWFRWLRLGMSLALGMYIWQQVSAGLVHWQQPGGRTWVWGVLAALLLLPFNVGLEALKWQLLVRRLAGLRHQPFGRAVQAVLAGQAAGIFTPNRIGEYAGRLLFLPAGLRWQGASFTLINRLAQMLATLWAGGVGLLLLDLSWLPNWLAYLVQGLGLTAALMVPLVPIACRWLVSRIPAGGIAAMLQAVAAVRYGLLMQVLGTAVLRYGVFAGQYVLLLWVCGYTGDPWRAAGLVAVVFLLKSCIPSLTLAELGIRESVALAVMVPGGIAAPTVLAATFALFLLNLVLPALLGLGIWYTARTTTLSEGPADLPFPPTEPWKP
ncbi:MAG: hypothetical protein OHK0039_00400 [Bacteroidia bacterium]